MAADVTREEFEGRVSVIEREVEVRKWLPAISSNRPAAIPTTSR
jgi:hypothetical protein